LLIAASILVLFIAIISNQDFHVASLETNNRNLYVEIISFLVYLDIGEVTQMHCDFH
jgi:hypothetical protein